jgi:hypothetical protein
MEQPFHPPPQRTIVAARLVIFLFRHHIEHRQNCLISNATSLKMFINMSRQTRQIISYAVSRVFFGYAPVLQATELFDISES